VPSWRSDVTAEIDLVEEIARLHGYDEFSDEVRPFRPGTVPDDPQWIVSRQVRDLLVGQGLIEVRPMPFVSGGDSYVRVANPLAENEAHLRRGVIESLVHLADYNLAHMRRDIRLFEIGDVFMPSGKALPIEELHVGVLVMGRRMPRHFTDPSGEEFDRWASYDRWDVTAMAREICRAAFGGELIAIIPGEKSAKFSTTLEVEWVVSRGGATIGHIGRVSLDAPVWASVAWGIELSLGGIESAAPAERGRHSYVSVSRGLSGNRPLRPLPTSPAAEFDLALLLGSGLAAADVERVIRASAGELLEHLELFDEYIGDGVPAGMRSVAWRLTFRHPERTLRDKEIDGRRAKILSALEKELNVRARTS
jgi:phenylalanyl-tRNA synthetase beta chain